MGKFYFTGFLFFVLHTLCGQNDWVSSSTEEFSRAIMSIEQSIPENSSYSYETEYTFYEELESVTPVMTESALLVCSKGKEIYMEQFGKVIVQNETVNVMLDSNSGSIVLGDAVKDFTRRKSASDFSALYTSGSIIEKKVSAGKTVFYIRFPEGFRYSGAEITMGGLPGVEKCILYSGETTFENTEGKEITAQPRMEIVYKKFVQGDQVNTGKMKRVSDFVSLIHGEYVLADKYKDYELIDLRSQPE